MKNQPVSVLYKASLYLVILLLSALPLCAQVDITIGSNSGANGNSTYPCPIQDYYEGSRAQYLYRASELIAAGMQPGFINAVKFTVNSLNSANIIDGYTIKIAATAKTTLDVNVWEPSGNAVFGPVNYQVVTGVNSFPVLPTFFWNGTDNLLVEVCNGGTGFTGNPSVRWTTGLSFNGSHTFRSDGLGNLCGTGNTSNSGTMTTRPDIILNYTPAAACTGVPEAGTTATTATNVCGGNSFTLSLTGNTAATGLTYQWQSSADNTNWTNIPGANTAFLNRTQAASTYYRCVVTCTASGSSDNSTAVQVVSPALIHGWFTIDKTSPAGGGNFTSFNAAYDYIKCGIDGPVVFNVAPGSGVYDEQLIIMPVSGASATNTITFNGAGQTITYLPTNQTQSAVIKLNGADYFTFNNLKIVPKGTTSSQWGFGVQLINDADFNTIDSCVIPVQQTLTSSSYAGIVVSASDTDPVGRGNASCDDNTFSYNTITGGYYGITLVGSSNVANQRNKVLNNTISEFYNRGVYVHGAFNAIIKNNTFSRPTRSNVTTFTAVGLSDLSTKVIIDGNRISNPFGGALTSTSAFYGILLENVDAITGLENEVINNLVYGLNGNGVRYGIYNNGSSNIRIYHNTISMDGTSTTNNSSSRIAGYNQSSTAAGVEFINNIITLTGTSNISQYGIYFGTAYPTSDVISDKNDIYINPLAANKYTGFYEKNLPTLSEWQTAAQQDANSFAVNPFYQDIATGNYSATSAMLNNRGAVVNVAIDINNAARNVSAPDLGAYEFTPPPCVTPPTGGTAQVSKAVVCAGNQVVLSLTGNTMGLSQTYQWQYATTAAGPYTNMGAPSEYADSTITATSTLYYRAALTCGVTTGYSAPVLLTVNNALPGGIYTIDKNTPASVSNFVSFNAAKDAMQCGIAGPVIFNVVAGRTTYEEQLVLDSIPGTSAINTITFNGNGNTIHFSGDNTAERAVIKLRKADHITFDSLRIDATGTGAYGYGVQLFNHADSNTITRCEIMTKIDATGSEYNGIVVSSSDQDADNSSGNNWCNANVFTKNKVSGGYYGITLTGISNNATKSNVVLGNKVLDYYSAGIQVRYSVNTQIAENTIDRPTRQDNNWSVYGISLGGRADGAKIARNKIANATPQADDYTYYGISLDNIDVDETKPDTVVNNIIYSLNSTGSRYGVYVNWTGNIVVTHNTVSVDREGSSLSWEASTGAYINFSDNIKFTNNNITVTSTGTGPKHAIEISGGTVSHQNNNYFVKAGGTENYIGDFNGDRRTLAEWKTATGQDTSATDYDPIYTDLAGGNLSPLFYKMDNTGTPEGIAIDILGKPRSATTPDVGAYEISMPLCQTPINAGKAVVNPSSGICMGTMISLDLIDNTTAGRLTYQWQASYAATGPWINISDTAFIPAFKTELGANNYFRCQLVCSNTDTAWSVVTSVNMNQPLIKGVYTINPTGTGNRNFTSFRTAVAAMECGIAGEVIFDVVPGTYTEQVYMHRIPGASDTSRVTFRSQNGNPASVTLTFAGTTANNYVLKLDSASYITYKNITITASNATNGRAVVFDGNAIKDSLLNNTINVPAVTVDNTDAVGVFAEDFKGGNIAIIGNTIKNGASGIHFSGPSDVEEVRGLVIDSNKVSGVFTNGISITNVTRPVVTKNEIDIKDPLAAAAYGIVLNHGDTAYRVSNNTVTISNTTGNVTGIALQDCQASAAATGLVEANRIVALTGNAGMIWGISNNGSNYNTTVNNVISVKTTGAVAYGLYSNQGNNINYYNNSVYNASAAVGANVAGYFSHTNATEGNVKLRNNIFSNEGGGVAAEYVFSEFINSDYNTYYTTGPVLISRSGTSDDYDNLTGWIAASDLDISSIVYKPAFASTTTLEPELSNPDVWAIHGRGVQIPGNDHDINKQSRPVTLTAGVPDMGAYEFLPTAQPTVLQAIPATPAPGITQQFLYGSDTVAKITWDPNTAVPTAITLKRYSGVVPPNLAPGTQFMYFYTDVDVTGSAAYKFKLEQFYVDSWLGYLDREKNIRLGRTDAANTWIINDSSTVDVASNIIADTALQYLDKFTGLRGKLIFEPSGPAGADTSNAGTRFWVAYGHDRSFMTNNNQNLALYLVAGQTDAHVVVKVNGTAWGKDYLVPANTSLTTDMIPKSGLSDARLTGEGLYPFGISIESDAPITAYAHQYSQQTAGATLLMPVGTYGYEYRPMSARQVGDANSFSWFYIIADNDSSVVEITPSQATVGGHAAGQPFTVTLNRGEVYQVLGAMKDQNEGNDLSGSIVRAVQNANGKCYPVAVFSGNSYSAFSCGGTGGFGNDGDNVVQQNQPVQSWGKTFMTAPTSGMADPVRLMTNIYRVLVKDPATVVTRNNTPLTGLINNSYYEFESKTADYIVADKPVTVAQYFTIDGSCNNPTGGDVDMVYLTPAEQAIKKATFYRNNEAGVQYNFITLVIHKQGLNSLLIDGSNTFSYSFNHANRPNYVVITKRWNGGNALSTIKSDSAFTAITYGFGNDVSYAYNVGMQIRNLNVQPAISNVHNGTGNKSTYTCAKTPFRLTAMLPMVPATLAWQLSQVANLQPATDVVTNNPVPVDTLVIDGQTYYKYEIAADYTFTTPGTYQIPVKVTNPDIASCDNSITSYLSVKVLAAPHVDFSISYNGCISDIAVFNGTAVTENNAAITKWEWKFGDGTTANTRSVTKQYAAAGSYTEELQVITKDGCVGDTVKTIEVNEPVAATLNTDTLRICAHTDATFSVQNPDPNASYNWYNAATGGALIKAGATLEIKDATSAAVYYVETTKGGCAGLARTPAVLLVLPQLGTPVLKVDSIGVDQIRFTWNEISGAAGYLVSTDNGATWITPSSGAQGLEHVIRGLKPQQSVTLLVKATGCEDKLSQAVTGKTLPDGVYIPSGFSPNGDGLNDVWKVYGAVVREIHFMVFNQWGEKIFESNNPQLGWDGSYKGKAQPSGVYIYICKLKLADGTQVDRKGTLNLLR
ncbi:gliding motility-associated C-terminal domain-containing protein [Chitinophaga filiformis]|uniref:Gliding motility-associated C-terminal domain-containing protein n=1 Tax=Chitinophaga filiformis TaxID=104663 RepID=A0ABY4I6R4_CHIFI|nr:gliding motility-associated C-terminal domain-containing protein [Chitinophaga filiformis]UPK71780.1 gliding motility-associated C-terminal domain-containing protein [Chitinophaga filiformis]